MKKLSFVLIIFLIVSSMVGCSCSLRNNTDELDNDGLADILDPANEDNEIDPSDGLSIEDDTKIDGSNNYHIDPSEDVESATSIQAESELGSEKNDTENKETKSETENDTVTPTETQAPSESETNAVKVEESTEYSESPAESTSDSATIEPEEELYDGMELTLPESKELINEAYTAGMMLSGYPVAKGSGRIILVDKDNPNLIQIVFETYDENILIGVNYYRTNENSKWKLINGASISIIDLTETEE